MSLTSLQFRQLEDALLCSFDEPSLTQVVRLRLGEDLLAIAGGANLREIVFNLISWAERTGYTDELILGASAANPDNPELRAFITEYLQSGASHQPAVDGESPYPSGGDTPITAGAPPVQQLDTQGGAYVAGNLATSGGDFVGRDKIVTIQQALSESDIRDQSNRRVLREMVSQYWIEGVLKHSLDHEVAIRLGIADRSSLVENRPWRVIPQQTDETARTLPPGISIVEVFDQMGQRMLILGEPGAGKTTTLLELASALIKRADDALALPSPVVFNLSSWIQRKAPLAEWLVDELGIRYSIPKKLAQAWIEHDKLLLLLDGLDEVQSEYRSDCVEAINQFLQDHLVPLTVCSRLAEYEALSVRLKLRGAVLLQPLSAEQVDAYLNRAGPIVSAIRNALQQDVELGELAKSPLMLSIMALAYQGVSPAELALSDAAPTRRQHLFDAYIQRMFVRRELEPIYSPQQTICWLHWLSARLVQYGQTVFLIERMQPVWLQSTDGPVHRPCIMLLAGPLFGFGVGLIYGLIYGLIFGLIFAPSVGLSVGLSSGLIFGLIFGLSVGLIFGLIDTIRGGLKLIHAPEQSRVLTNRLKSSLLAMLFWGLIYGLIYGLIFAPSVGLIGGLIFGLLGGLSGGLIGGLSGELIKIEPIELAKLKNNLFVRLRFGLIFGLSVGLSVGLIFGLSSGLSSGRTGGLIFGLVFGLIFGLIVGLVFGLIFGLIFQPYSETDFPITIETRVPNQGIRVAARYAAIAGLGGGLIFGLIFGLTFTLNNGLGGGLIGGLIGGLLGGVIGGLIGGGDVVTKHCLLRIGLQRQGHIPWNYARFLDYATGLIFLRKVGGGYIFVHRLIMEHFAALDEQDIERITAFSNFPNSTHHQKTEREEQILARS